MTDQLISFETLELAMSKGFIWYDHKRRRMPTQSLLQKWLREKHNLIVEPIGSVVDKTFGIKIFYLGKIATKLSIGGPNYGNTYEEALEAGLIEALKLIP